MFLDYYCPKCEQIIEYRKKDNEEYSDEVKVTCCKDDKKKCKVKRHFTKSPVMDVCEGLLGNAKDGYTGGSATYMKSPLTPNNKAFIGGRTISVEGEHKGGNY